MNNFRVALVMAFIVLLITGCAINKGTVNSYVEPTYERGSIKTVAVFPIRNARLSPSEARRINKLVIQGLLRRNPDVKIVSPSESLRKINDSNLAEEWASFIEDYFTSGIPNKQILTKVAKHLSVDAVMQGNILNVYQVDGDGWKVRAQARITVELSMVETKTAKTICLAFIKKIREIYKMRI